MTELDELDAARKRHLAAIQALVDTRNPYSAVAASRAITGKPTIEDLKAELVAARTDLDALEALFYTLRD